MKTKYYHYIAVKRNKGYLFITELNNSNHTCHWIPTDKPLNINMAYSKEILIGLLCNGYEAFILTTPTELKTHILYNE